MPNSLFSLDELKKRMQSDPSDYEARFALGMQYKRSCQLDDAIREFKAVAETVPDLAVAHYELGKTYLLKGDNAEASKALERALRFEPDNMDPRFLLRYVPRLTKPLREALEAAGKAVAARPDDAEAHNRLGVCLVMADDLDCGMAEFIKAIELAPENAEYHLNEGYTDSFYDEEEALHEVKMALHLNPRWLDAMLLMGALYMDTKRVDDAICIYKKALTIEPDSDLLHYLLGYAYLQSDDTKGARGELERAVVLNRDNYAARRVLVELYLADGLKGDAIGQLEELVRMEPGVKTTRETLEKLKVEG